MEEDSSSKFDPVCANSDRGVCLILGVSMSGKSHLVKSVIKHICTKQLKKNSNFSTNLYVINSLKNEYSDLLPCIQTQNINLSSCNQILDNSFVVVEDIIGLKLTENFDLRQILNFKVHHDSLRMYLISHSIYKTNIFSLLGYFGCIIISGSKSNLSLIRNLGLYFKFEKKDMQKHENHMLNKDPNIINDYYIMKVSEKKLFYANSINDLLSNNFSDTFTDSNSKNETNTVNSSSPSSEESTISYTKKEYFERFVFLLNGYRFKAAAISIASIIINYINLTKVRLEDLTISFTTKKNKHFLPLLDYLHCLLSFKAKPNKSIILFHKFIIKKCNIPIMYVKNYYFLKKLNKL